MATGARLPWTANACLKRDDRYRSGGAGFVIDEGTIIADGLRSVNRLFLW